MMFAHIIITVSRYHSLPDIWKCESINEVLENHRQGLNDSLLHNLIIRIDISWCSCALLMLSALSIFSITYSLKQNEESLGVEPYCCELGTVQLVTRKVVFEAKKLSLK